MNDQMQDKTGAASARRRLIRGTFGVPAVLTLYSGGALAASSSRCLANATATASTGPVITSTVAPTADTYLRIQLTKDSLNNLWFVGSSVGSFTRAPVDSSGIPATGAFRRFDISQNTFLAGSVSTTTPLNGPVLSDKWVALRFNSAGQLVGVGASGTGSVVGSSCWTSAV